jgi:hypothetical protein
VKRLLPLLILALSASAFATISVKRDLERSRTINVSIVNEPLSVAVRSLELYLPRGVQIFLSDDPRITYRARRVDPVAALRGMAAAAHVSLYEDKDRYWIRDDREPSVTLDVKDEDVRAILKSMQKQCELKNLIIDPDVQGKATFLFRDVPCRTAFDIVFRTFGLKSVTYSNSVVTVSSRR